MVLPCRKGVREPLMGKGSSTTWAVDSTRRLSISSSGVKYSNRALTSRLNLPPSRFENRACQGERVGLRGRVNRVTDRVY